MIVQRLFLKFVDHFSYFGIFVAMTFSGYLIPLPEEILLLLFGYIVGTGFGNLYLVMAFSFLGVIAGDNILYWMALGGSKYAKRFEHRLNRQKLAKYKMLMKKNIGKTIFFSKFILGLRIIGPLLAGSLKVKWKKFQLYSLLATLIYAPSIVFIGYHFHNRLASISRQVEIARHIVFLIITLLLLVFMLAFVREKYYRKG